MIAASVSIARTADAGGPSPLVIAHNGATFRVAEGGIGRPAKTWRFVDMPDADGIHGTEHVAASLEESSLPLKVLVTAGSSSALEDALDELEEALAQFSYEVTVTIGGVSRVWIGSPANTVASLDSGEAAAHISTVSVTIPVHPIPGGA